MTLGLAWLTVTVLLSCLILHDDFAFLNRAIRSVIEAGPVFAFVSGWPWHGAAGDWEQAARIAEEARAEVVPGDWPSEEEHRRFALAYLAEKGFTHALIPDGDGQIECGLRAERQEAKAPHPGPLLGKEREKGRGGMRRSPAQRGCERRLTTSPRLGMMRPPCRPGG